MEPEKPADTNLKKAAKRAPSDNPDPVPDLSDLDSFCRRLSELTAKQSEAKVAQFSIETMQDPTTWGRYSEYARDLRSLGVWGGANLKCVFEAIEQKRPFNVIVGFRPSRFHAGHLTLARELNYYLERGGKPVFVVSASERGGTLTDNDARTKVVEFWDTMNNFLSTSLSMPEVTVSDSQSLPIRILSDQVASVLKVSKVQQLYGWGRSESIARLNTPAAMAAAFLSGPVLGLSNSPSVITADVNQVTHYEVAKLAARKLGLEIPAISYRVLLPSLKNPQDRMSVKVPSSVLFIDEEDSVVDKKLRKSCSAGMLSAEEQRLHGGDPVLCSFFRLAQVVLDQEEANEVAKDCFSGSKLCGECKSDRSSAIVKAMRRARGL